MSKEMKIDARMIRSLRELRGWSQEQLAEAAGLGLRTVQRVESDGRASAETRTCLAAAFTVPQSVLTGARTVPQRVRDSAGPTLGLVGTFLIAVGLLTGEGPGLLLAGTGILIAMLFVYALEYIDGRREAAGRGELLSPATASVGGLLVAGLSTEALGWIATGGPVWAGLIVAALGLALAAGHWLVSRLIGPESPSEQGES
ncbi:MAG: helix-turn-helix transcriptional regulator [Wenzhouxiangella sp.]|nr:helix-turn-helix transcriptional regulator [Wenzhouxiangella sp.]MCH8479335.1 helix-turn-helix domain-containing protein [Wenzhouxiangella sp.]